MSYECFKNLLFLPPNPLKCRFYASYISSNVADIAFYHIHLGFAKKSKLLMILLYIEFQFEFVFVAFARAVNAEESKQLLMDEKKGRFNQVRYLNVIKVASLPLFERKITFEFLSWNPCYYYYYFFSVENG